MIHKTQEIEVLPSPQKIWQNTMGQFYQTWHCDKWSLAVKTGNTMYLY